MPRWPFPIGATRSMMRSAIRRVGPCSRRNRSSGNSGVSLSKSGRAARRVGVHAVDAVDPQQRGVLLAVARAAGSRPSTCRPCGARTGGPATATRTRRPAPAGSRSCGGTRSPREGCRGCRSATARSRAPPRAPPPRGPGAPRADPPRSSRDGRRGGHRGSPRRRRHRRSVHLDRHRGVGRLGHRRRVVGRPADDRPAAGPERSPPWRSPWERSLRGRLPCERSFGWRSLRLTISGLAFASVRLGPWPVVPGISLAFVNAVARVPLAVRAAVGARCTLVGASRTWRSCRRRRCSPERPGRSTVIRRRPRARRSHRSARLSAGFCEPSIPRRWAICCSSGMSFPSSALRSVVVSMRLCLSLQLVLELGPIGLELVQALSPSVGASRAS